MERRPWVTWAFAAGIVAFAWRFTGFVPTEASVLAYAWSQEAWRAGDWGRLVTSVFAHGGPVHLVGNLFSLLALGSALEVRLGSARVAALLAVAGVFGNFAHAATSGIPVVGASGAIFGLIGALLLLAPAERVVILFFRTPVAVAAAFYAALVALVPAFSAGPVSHGAHLGGLVGGALLGVFYDVRAALRHAPWVAAIFLLAFAAVAWLASNDATRVVPVWREGGFLAAVLFLKVPLGCVVGIGVSLAVLDRHAAARAGVQG